MNFGTGDTIVIEGAVGTGTLDTGSVSVSSAANWDYVSFVVDFGSSTYAYRVDIQTSITNPNFVLTEDANGGADITVEEEVTCFLLARHADTAGVRRVARVLANQYRADLRAVGIGSGCHGFMVELPAGVAGRIEVVRAGDGAALCVTKNALAQAA